MRARIKRGWPWLAACILLAGTALADRVDLGVAQEVTGVGPEAYERIAFDAADTNFDGVVSQAELARDAARGFATLDKNHDGFLTPDELSTHDPAQFKRVDANGDGKLSFAEVMENKLRALKAGDKDGDGTLSFDEMVSVVESEMGGGS